jgi:succinate-semialdehyde dehydrogenase/glutarate-semialdehyde dehydrogenase
MLAPHRWLLDAKMISRIGVVCPHGRQRRETTAGENVYHDGKITTKNEDIMLTLNDPTLLRHQAYIDGEWCDAQDAQTVHVTNPATGADLGTVPHMGALETKRAIAAAAAAWPAWRKKTAKERSVILRKWNDLMLENADDLAAIMTAEQGKPLLEAKGEITYAASFIEWFAEEAKRIAGDTLESPSRASRIVVTREPIGVCAAITPWISRRR